MAESVPVSKRKVCFVITSKIHYARNRLILEKLRDHPDIELQIVVGGSALIDRFGKIDEDLVQDGFTITDEVLMVLDSSSPTAMAKSTGIGIIEFATIFGRLKPDIVLIRGDRYEMLAPTTAAAYMNIAVAHIEGGDVTGSIDESVRHAITKLSHIHFATNENAAQRIIAMGENPDYVFTVGSPELEVVATNNFTITKEFIHHNIGVGDLIDIDRPYIVVMQHPVTTEHLDSMQQIEETIEAITSSSVPAIWFWPNVDAGSDLIAKRIRQYRERDLLHNIRFLKYLPQEQFYGLLKGAHCLVGNSSSGLKECAFLGVPVVNIGTRQSGRYMAGNVTTVDYDRGKIAEAIKKQVEVGRYPEDRYYHRDKTSDMLVELLVNIPLYQQKRFYEAKK